MRQGHDMLLEAATPRDWLDTHLAAFFDGDGDAAGRVHRELTVASLTANGAAELRALHGHLTGEGSPGPAASRYLSGWFGGLAATALGYAIAGSGAGFILEPGATAWRLHPEIWTNGMFLAGARTAVPPDHPWAGQPHVEVIADAGERHARIVAALVETVAPIVDAIRPLAKGGLAGLWNEVGDGFASALVYQSRIPVTDVAVADLRGLIAVPGAPWTKPSALWPVELPHGRACIMRKGGCCLSYTEPPRSEDDDHENDQDHRDFHARYPHPPNAPHYCENCSFRPAESCEELQSWWRTREHENREAGIA